MSYFLDGTRLDLSKTKNPENPHKYWVFGTFLEQRKGVKYMKATGIVRRVDDLGRIVIPKRLEEPSRLERVPPY